MGAVTEEAEMEAEVVTEEDWAEVGTAAEVGLEEVKEEAVKAAAEETEEVVATAEAEVKGEEEVMEEEEVKGEVGKAAVEDSEAVVADLEVAWEEESEVAAGLVEVADSFHHLCTALEEGTAAEVVKVEGMEAED